MEGRLVHQDFDVVVLALPYNQLQTIEMADERLRRAMVSHVAHYDSPGHYLRISILFDKPFWRRLLSGSWVTLDAFGGCCVYDGKKCTTRRRRLWGPGLAAGGRRGAVAL